MKHLFLPLILFNLIQTVSAYNPVWVRIDRKLIHSVIQLERANPKEVEEYFLTQKIQKCDTTKINLGFGWSMWNPGIGGGYASISATFFYFHDSIVSYSIYPSMPEEKGLVKRYKAWYNDNFKFSSSTILPYVYNYESILKPLKEYQGKLDAKSVHQDILEYMTPNSGLVYGYYGGDGQLLPNRAAFNSIKDNLINDQLVLLMYSINPVSRLTSIEYYLQHRINITNPKELDEWVEKNFIEIPKIKVPFGCYSESWDTRIIVNMNSYMAK